MDGVSSTHEELEREASAMSRERLEAAYVIRTLERNAAEAKLIRLLANYSPVIDEGNSWEGPGPYPGRGVRCLR